MLILNSWCFSITNKYLEASLPRIALLDLPWRDLCCLGGYTVYVWLFIHFLSWFLIIIMLASISKLEFIVNIKCCIVFLYVNMLSKWVIDLLCYWNRIFIETIYHITEGSIESPLSTGGATTAPAPTNSTITISKPITKGTITIRTADENKATGMFCLSVTCLSVTCTT